MTRKAFLLLLSLSLVLASTSVQARGKAKKKDESRILKVGDEVSVFIVGDEARGKPNLNKAGIVSPDALVLPLYLQDAPPRPPSPANVHFGLVQSSPSDDIKDDHDDQTISEFSRAANIGDRHGIVTLMNAGRAVRVPVGTRLLVLSINRHDAWAASLLPAPSGTCRARIIDGTSQGKICEIPIRNLR